MRRDLFSEHLEWAEGRRAYPYEDSVGKLTIGVGRNLEDRGLRPDEIDLMKKNDMAEAEREASGLPYWQKLGDIRRVVVADMVFNLGLSRFVGFVRTNEALAAGDYDRAAAEMIDSKWYRQTGRRAKRLVEVMRSGQWPNDKGAPLAKKVQPGADAVRGRDGA